MSHPINLTKQSGLAAYYADRSKFGPTAHPLPGDVSGGVIRPWDGSGAVKNSAEQPAPPPSRPN